MGHGLAGILAKCQVLQRIDKDKVQIKEAIHSSGIKKRGRKLNRKLNWGRKPNSKRLFNHIEM